MDDTQNSTPGLDYAQALNRLGGNTVLLQAVLASFVETYQSLPQQLPHLAAQQDWEALRVLCHTLKGSAANISATRLSRAGAEVEALIKQGQLPVPEFMWRECLAAWSELEPSLNKLMSVAETDEGKELTATELMVRLVKLLPLIETDLAAADSAFIELRTARVPERFQANFSMFIKQFDAFDLKGAKVSLNRMLGRDSNE